MRLISWNVNGIRAATRKGFLDWMASESPDVLCAQETKAQPDQLVQKLRQPPGYHAYWNSAQRKGYSGVATFSKTEPLHVQAGFGIEEFDVEGRVLMTGYPGFKRRPSSPTSWVPITALLRWSWTKPAFQICSGTHHTQLRRRNPWATKTSWSNAKKTMR